MLHTTDSPFPSRTERSFRKRLLLGWALAFGLATLLILLSTGQNYFYNLMRDREGLSFWRILLWPAIWWYVWALLAPFIYELARRFPLTRSTWKKHLGVYLLGGLFFFCFHVGVQLLAMLMPTFQMVHADWWDALSHHILSSIYLNTLVFWAVVGFAHAYRYYQRARRRELTAAQLESELARAQLHALKTQLHPHFLFNTLHTISTLMYRDVRAADRMLAHLSDLLRMALDSSDAQEVPLSDEKRFLEKYLEIEQTRFEDRLTVHIDIDPGFDEVLVPSLVLQPIVENALKHGIATRSGPGTVAIKAWAENGHLHLQVADDGPGMPATPNPNRSGIGLTNIRDRLARLYGDAHLLRFTPAKPSGLIVDLTLPFRKG